MQGTTANSSLRFENYIVNKVIFEKNDSTDSQKDTWVLDFDINNQTRVNDDKNEMEIILSIRVFDKSLDAPFHMEVEIMGKFILEGIEDDISIYEANAIAIMYPYLRSIVSTYTSAANIMPVILPAINVNAMLSKKTKS